jgi:hypothetical protein
MVIQLASGKCLSRTQTTSGFHHVAKQAITSYCIGWLAAPPSPLAGLFAGIGMPQAAAVPSTLPA